MYFQRIRHPSNFSFFQSFSTKLRSGKIDNVPYRYKIADLGSDIFHMLAIGKEALPNLTLSELHPPTPLPSQTQLTIGPLGEIVLRDAKGRPLLESVAGQAFGLCGKAWMLTFRRHSAMQFYGMGEKNIGFERSGQRTKFWNTDVWADFSRHDMQHGVTDPMYASVPYLIVKLKDRYIGILVDNPFPVFMDTGSTYLPTGPEVDPAEFFVGSSDGLASIYFIVGPSLEELTCKFQKLCGTTPLPPLWALGHHQCRWGYRSIDDLRNVNRKFDQYGIPNDGLWLDIDYMDGFRVFTFDSRQFKDPAQEIRDLRACNRHVIPILDPGIKIDPAYPLYQDGLANDVYCKTPQGGNFVGFVWPGKTVFPDFSLPKVKEWWAARVSSFLRTGVSGVWIDMNDPAVGPVELEDMRFRHGSEPHAAFHNQYGLAMAQATYEGFIEARAGERPFLISRSAFTGQSKYSAVWTGDNYASWHHLKSALQVTLNLALSGIPFNGPDIPGFGGEATPKLAEAWYKAGFLFPFLRNHCHQAFGPKEPWVFGAKTRTICAHFIRTRYKLLPYLYNLFIDQEERGSAILRPLFHDFLDTRELPLGKIDDQFLVGPSILQAPIYDKDKSSRKAVLPGSDFWYAAHEGRWIAPNRTTTTRQTDNSTPLYVREHSIIPMQKGIRRDNRNNLAQVELHIFLRKKSQRTASYQYRFDDGLTQDYRQGKRTSFRITASPKDRTLLISFKEIENLDGPASVQIFTYDDFKEIVTQGLEKDRSLQLSTGKWNFVGVPITVRRTHWIPIT